jgi:flavin reductase (DIM6/NTAB) family NADH-FMN oxidoreductase RutF
MEESKTQSTVVHPDPASLRDILRFWATGVAIVGAHHEGRTHGMTINSFTSVSLDPPLILVSLEKVTRTHALVETAQAFSVNLLSQDQRALSDRFAGRDSEGSQRFADVDTFTLETGSPILNEAIAFFDCKVHATHDAGTHTLIIGEVLAAGTPTEGRQPLLYFNRAYRQFS